MGIKKHLRLEKNIYGWTIIGIIDVEIEIWYLQIHI
jgi:hypothetical protein